MPSSLQKPQEGKLKAPGLLPLKDHLRVKESGGSKADIFKTAL